MLGKVNIMAECPKCGYKLRVKDWRPECPKCGVNVVYYGIEDQLREEADRAEYSHAKMQPRFDRLKFSLIGHPLSIVRLCIGLLPIVALLLPMGHISYALPFGTHETGVNLVSIITFFVNNGFDFDLITSLFGGKVLGNTFIYWAMALVGAVGVMLISLIGFFLLTLSAAPRGMKRNIGFPIAGIVLATIGFVGYVLMINELNGALPGLFAGSVLPFAYIGVVICFAAMIAVNVIYKKKNIEVKYTDVSELLLPYNERPSTIAKNAKASEKEAANA